MMSHPFDLGWLVLSLGCMVVIVGLVFISSKYIYIWGNINSYQTVASFSLYSRSVYYPCQMGSLLKSPRIWPGILTQHISPQWNESIPFPLEWDGDSILTRMECNHSIPVRMEALISEEMEWPFHSGRNGMPFF